MSIYKQKILKLLEQASSAYYSGNPILTDSQFDRLTEQYNTYTVGATVKNRPKVKHLVRLYSLDKYYPGEGKPPLADYTGAKVVTPKLDGAAIALVYESGVLVSAATRGNGLEGMDITDKISSSNIVPLTIDVNSLVVMGEVVAPKDIANARNYAAGALNLNSIEEFLTRTLFFVAYDSSLESPYYTDNLNKLTALGFHTVLDSDYCDMFRHDGKVVRVDSSADFLSLGYNTSWPNGAYAIKTRNSEQRTILREVVWQTGRSGRVTPVAVFDPIMIDGAQISRATLNNPAFIEALDLDIGDFVYVERAGDIIPAVVRSEKIWP